MCTRLWLFETSNGIVQEQGHTCMILSLNGILVFTMINMFRRTVWSDQQVAHVFIAVVNDTMDVVYVVES